MTKTGKIQKNTLKPKRNEKERAVKNRKKSQMTLEKNRKNLGTKKEKKLN